MTSLRCLVASISIPFTGFASGEGHNSLFEIDFSRLTNPPLWEPSLDEYFPVQRGGERDDQGLASPVVLTEPSLSEFAYHARKGYPILVSDWGKDMTYNGWSGRSFSEAFPFGYMKAEYIHDMPGFKRKDHDVKVIDGELRFNLGNFKPDKKTMWHNFTRPASKRYKDDPQKPETGPYVWHVKDELTPQQKKLVQARFEAPSFLKDPLNSAWMNRTFEIWFSPGSGSGAGAHNDGYCESVVSLQLKGEKKWRKMMEPEMTFLHSYDEFDGGVYQAGLWKPDIGFVLTPGQAVIWPPGYLHETKTFQPADGECGTAMTLQFAFPQPVQFLRAFLPRLSLSAEVGQCVARTWTAYALFFVSGIKPSPKDAMIETQKDAILSHVDADKDGQITVEETKDFLKSGKASHALAEKREMVLNSVADAELFYRFVAEDTVAYHDKNDDMIVSTQELWDSLVQWNVVRVRMQEGLKFVNKADKAGLEAFETSLDFMRRSPVKLPKKLRPELKALFSLPKGTKIFPKIGRINSFSDQEFFSEARDRVDQLVRETRSRGEL